MPKDTGRAAASWGHSSAPAEAGDGVWVEEDDGMSITQGTTVVYVPRLNEGHSQQAPAGFLDAIFERNLDLLLDSIVNSLEDAL